MLARHDTAAAVATASADEDGAFLRMAAVEKHFDDAVVLKGIDLAIRQGSFVSLLGPSGCGKTTSLRCIAGFEHPDRGAVLLRGVDITRHEPEQRNFGMVFQSYALFPHLTVHQNVAFGLEMRKVPRAERNRRVDEMLQLVQLADKGDRYPRQLSGGQQQRVALARAMVIEPDIVLLDEPLANLDAVLRDEMRIFIREIQRKLNLTVVYVTHDQAEALAMSDKVVVMFDGEIAQVGSPTEVYGNPASTRVASFIGRSNLLKGTVVESNSASTRVETALGTLQTRARDGLATGQQVTVLIRPEALRTADGAAETGAASFNVFSGVIERASFAGSAWDAALRTASGDLLTFFLPPEAAPSSGTAATLVATAASCSVLTS